jgi:hypothetical protein
MLRLNKVWLFVLIGLLAGGQVKAASVEMAPTVKASFDKMAASADRSVASRLTSAYQDVLTLDERNRGWDQNVAAVHSENADRLSALSEQLKHLDADKRQQLEEDYRQAKQRYQPLFDTYKALNKQVAFARLFKSKEASVALRAQADAMKMPLDLARQEIKTKLDAWNGAKKSTADTVKRVRATIAETKPLQDQIKAKKKSITSMNQRFSEVWKSFSPAARKGDAAAALHALTGAVSAAQQRNDLKEGVYALEIGIRDILQRAKNQLE